MSNEEIAAIESAYRVAPDHCIHRLIRELREARAEFARLNRD
jgi:hypothetical protein